jgi:predicted dehydrogenase
MNGRRRLRLGMVGGGEGAFIGAVHRIAARLDDQYELVAGALASEPDKARRSGTALGLAEERNYGTYREMAEAEARRSDRIDAVSIVTPNHVHHEVARCFLEAGIHVICDKPLTTSLERAEELVSLTEKSGRIFAVTYNYSGYPMVRHARELILGGEIGDLRVVQVEYPQGWLAERLEDSGQKQAVWRTDPEQSGPAGCLGDIGTHALHLAEFTTGDRVAEVAADLETFVAGRRLDDNVHVLMRFSSGAKGMLWASQVAPGHENGLRVRLYGSKGGIGWSQENPNYLTIALNGTPTTRVTRSGAGAGAAAAHATRLPGGHPEGYLEAFAQIYTDTAELIWAKMEQRDPDPMACLVPDVREGARGVRFVASVLESSRAGGAWTRALP